MALRPPATDGRPRPKFRGQESLGFESVEGRVDGAGSDIASETMLDLFQNRATVTLFAQLGLRTEQGQQDRLFEDAKVLSQLHAV